ncbi:MAG: chromosome segregation protein SMC [Sulfuricellaceae bacterium]
MRLTQIKLAGFKTFVDPTTIHFPGQRVGVVGPNGCGKSNVIDAMRWVLGESSARQLRGGSMQDVIFNGSGTRKPVSRASVEMVFDNSLGKAAGQWSQYAEVAVKRVLHRDGESGYYINNLHVRRRDITDIFLGTGLGARAYAIIEQGMISRIIEARPEELRVFLEEAAGISKYKERRRETETRLKDTRENLLRVDDIRQELAAQLQKLEAQAEVARQFLDLKQRLELAQNLFRLFKKREAQAQAERWQHEMQRLSNELEAETAALRQAESLLEQTREAHYAGADALHVAQGELYGANAEVARVEQSLQHSRENRQRLGARIAAAREQEARLTKQREEAQANLAHWRAEQEQAVARLEDSRERLAQETGQLPLAEQAFAESRRRYDDLQRNLNDARQALLLEETHRAHAEKMRQALHLREGRLQQEKNALPHFDADALAEKEEELGELALQLETIGYTQETLQEQLPAAEAARREAGGALQAARERITRIEAQAAALRQMQSRLDHNHKLQAWLAKHQLENLPRLWQNLSVEAGWDDALESVLRERLNALLVDSLERVAAWLDEPPPTMLAVSEDRQQRAEDRGQKTESGSVPGQPLMDYVSWSGGAMPSYLADSLHGVYVAEDPHAALAACALLAPGVLLVTRQGHLFSRAGVSFYAPQSELHGVLGRQREIDRLEQDLAAQQADAHQLKLRLEQAEAALTRLQRELTDSRAAIAEYQQRRHKLQLEAQRLAQIGQQVAQRAAKIAEELAEVAAQLAAENEQSAASMENLEQARMQIEALEEQLEALHETRTEAENRLNRQREILRGVERAAQEADFNERSCRAKIEELGHFLHTLDDQFDTIHAQLEELLEEQQSSCDEPLQFELQQALEQQRMRELALAAARDTLEAVTAQLRDIEGQRLRHEQKLNPLRDQVGDARLKEQEAHLTQEQFGAQLAEADADEEALAPLLDRNAKATTLQAEIARLDGGINALGAVNLAALEELQNARERLGYLESQANDLNEAMETLEQAIRRIDRETRERMQATFDQVNLHLSELFPLLFGGGQAQLVMTGEEILDAGVQMIAQPPGKRNSSIHLLSGGEKALTALALTFSLFQLNPAPFCLLDEVDAPLDDSNTERFCELVKKMSLQTQFIFISHNKITMEMAEQLIGVTMQEQGVSRVVAVDVAEAMKMNEAVVA